MSKRDAIDATRHDALGGPTFVRTVLPMNGGALARSALVRKHSGLGPLDDVSLVLLRNFAAVSTLAHDLSAHLYDGSFGGAARSALIDYLEAL